MLNPQKTPLIYHKHTFSVRLMLLIVKGCIMRN